MRSTFTFGGSQKLPKHVGTIDEFDTVLSALLEECFIHDSALGINIRLADLIEHIIGLEDFVDYSNRRPGHNLDYFIEAQVHGQIRLDRDVDVLVADPSFRGTETRDDFEKMSERFGFPLRTHIGFRMRATHVPLDFRGPTMPSLAARVAIDGILNVYAIGLAAQDLRRRPEAWRDGGNYGEVLQELKLLWHLLIRYSEFSEL